MDPLELIGLLHNNGMKGGLTPTRGFQSTAWVIGGGNDEQIKNAGSTCNSCCIPKSGWL